MRRTPEGEASAAAVATAAPAASPTAIPTAAPAAAPAAASPAASPAASRSPRGGGGGEDARMEVVAADPASPDRPNLRARGADTPGSGPLDRDAGRLAKEPARGGEPRRSARSGRSNYT